MAAVNTADAVGGNGTSLTTPGVTPGGSDRAVFAGANTSTSHATGVNYGGSGGTALNQISTDLTYLFVGFLNAWGRAGSPAAATDAYAAFGSSQSTSSLHAAFLTGVDQVTPFGTPQATSGDSTSGTATANSAAFTSLSVGQMVIGALGIWEGFGGGISSVTGSHVVPDSYDISPEAGSVFSAGAILVGFADGSGNCTLTATINEAAPSYVAWGVIAVPVNNAAGGGGAAIAAISNYYRMMRSA